MIFSNDLRKDAKLRVLNSWTSSGSSFDFIELSWDF
jgi:hypothetical protein